MTVRSFGAVALLGVLAILASADRPTFAQERGGAEAPATPPSETPAEPGRPIAPATPGPDHGAGASGKGDGSGMGQDTSEIGTPKGPGDKGGPPADKTVAPAICDDGRQPIDGACPG